MQFALLETLIVILLLYSSYGAMGYVIGYVQQGKKYSTNTDFVAIYALLIRICCHVTHARYRTK